MALRVLLVGLVASMGFELPDGQELSSWTKTGRDWFNARMVDLSNLRVEAERVIAEDADGERAEEPAAAPIEVASTRADLAFDAVVEGMASEFATDLASIEARKPPDEALAAVEPSREIPPAEQSDPSLEDPDVETLAEADPAPTAPAQAVEPPSRIERISTAVRLTREAMNAWASLIQPSPVKVAGDGRGDSL